jgi:hypothetical protein
MNFEKLIETISEILENEKIEKHGLMLTYYIHPKAHLAMNLELAHKINGQDANVEPTDEFEVEIGGILVKFLKKTYTEEN